MNDASGSKPPIGNFFIDNGDGTVTDTRTGLMWMRCAMGQTWDGTTCRGEASTYTWDEAMAIRHTFAGYDDWRLPAANELYSIFENRQYPAIDTIAFPGTRTQHFWSSSQQDKSNRAWTVYFQYDASGSVHKSNRLPTRLVRGSSLTGQSLEFFRLFVKIIGRGSGSVYRNPTKSNVIGDGMDRYPPDTSVTLTAIPDAGSFFVGWGQDCAGSDTTCTVTMSAGKYVTANFEEMPRARAPLIACLDVDVSFNSVEINEMEDGNEAFIFYFDITNRHTSRVCVALPLSSYVTNQGEEIEQDAWLEDFALGASPISINAGESERTGLVFNKSGLELITNGDKLYVYVDSHTSSQRFIFLFVCNDQTNNSFYLNDAYIDDSKVDTEDTLSERNDSEDSQPSTGLEMLPKVAGIVATLGILEADLVSTLGKFTSEISALRALLAVPPEVPPNDAPPETESPPTALTAAPFSQFLNWLAAQETVSFAELRDRLLPLDRIPGEVIDEINDRALDLAGEPAVEEDKEDEFIVSREVMARVIAGWEAE